MTSQVCPRCGTPTKAVCSCRIQSLLSLFNNVLLDNLAQIPTSPLSDELLPGAEWLVEPIPPAEEGDQEDADSLEGLNFLELPPLNPLEVFLLPSLRIEFLRSQAELGLLNCNEFLEEALELIESVKEAIARNRIAFEIPDSLLSRFPDLADPKKQAEHSDYHDRLTERLAWLEAQARSCLLKPDLN